MDYALFSSLPPEILTQIFKQLTNIPLSSAINIVESGDTILQQIAYDNITEISGTGYVNADDINEYRRVVNLPDVLINVDNEYDIDSILELSYLRRANFIVPSIQYVNILIQNLPHLDHIAFIVKDVTRHVLVIQKYTTGTNDPYYFSNTLSLLANTISVEQVLVTITSNNMVTNLRQMIRKPYQLPNPNIKFSVEMVPVVYVNESVYQWLSPENFVDKRGMTFGSVRTGLNINTLSVYRTRITTVNTLRNLYRLYLILNDLDSNGENIDTIINNYIVSQSELSDWELVQLNTPSNIKQALRESNNIDTIYGLNIRRYGYQRSYDYI